MEKQQLKRPRQELLQPAPAPAPAATDEEWLAESGYAFRAVGPAAETNRVFSTGRGYVQDVDSATGDILVVRAARTRPPRRRKVVVTAYAYCLYTHDFKTSWVLETFPSGTPSAEEWTEGRVVACWRRRPTTHTRDTRDTRDMFYGCSRASSLQWCRLTGAAVTRLARIPVPVAAPVAAPLLYSLQANKSYLCAATLSGAWLFALRDSEDARGTYAGSTRFHDSVTAPQLVLTPTGTPYFVQAGDQLAYKWRFGPDDYDATLAAAVASDDTFLAVTPFGGIIKLPVDCPQTSPSTQTRTQTRLEVWTWGSSTVALDLVIKKPPTEHLQQLLTLFSTDDQPRLVVVDARDGHEGVLCAFTRTRVQTWVSLSLRFGFIRACIIFSLSV